MNKIDTLSQEEQDEIIEHFKTWSGGFPPDQCPEFGYEECTHQCYIEFALNPKFKEKSELVEDFLRYY